MAEDGFRTFVEQRYGKLLRTAYALTGSEHAAEDLLQSALLAMMPHWRAMDQPEAYARRTMVNLLVSRQRRRRVIEVLSAILPERPTQPEQPEQPELRDELWRALGRLPARMRTVLVLRYWEDMSEAETAELLDCSIGTVKSQASRGLVRLRKLLADNLPDTHPDTVVGELT